MAEDIRAWLRQVERALTPRPAQQIRQRGDQRRRRAALISGALALALLAATGTAFYAASGQISRSAPVVSKTHHANRSQPAPAARHRPYLSAVSCVTGTDCWAVGQANGGQPPVVEHWDGTRWSPVAVPVPHAVFLSLVSCHSASGCWAAEVNPLGVTRNAVHWNGTSWHQTAFALPGGARHLSLSRIACAGAADCWAVGYGSRGGVGQPAAPVAEHWNGTAWSIVPAPGRGRQSGLSAVACAGSANCWAIGVWAAGGGSGGTLTEHWNGSSWSRASTPTANGGRPTFYPNAPAPTYIGFGPTMTDLACAEAMACMAVGNGAYDGTVVSTPSGSGLGGSRALTQYWSGSAWADVGTPAMRHVAATDLTAVSCPGRSWCMAVGLAAPRAGAARSLCEIWNGTAWSIVPAPQVGHSREGDSLTSVSCPAARDCWVTGIHGPATFLAHWNGSTWSKVPL